jgi:hypothetical protein
MSLFADTRALMACATLFAVASLAKATDPAEREEHIRQMKSKPTLPPPPLDPNRTNWELRDVPLQGAGVVTEVTDSSITLKRFKDGKVVKYTAHTALARGEVMEAANGSCGYRLQDITVGDEVGLGGMERMGVTYCLCLCIQKRPGGRLPPAFKDEGYWKYHETENEIADLEEHGIPLSDKLIGSMMSYNPLRIKSEKIKAALKAKARPPERIEKLKD